MKDLCAHVATGTLPLLVAACLLHATICFAFPVDTSPQPDRHPPLAPEDGAAVVVNPPEMIWRVDEAAVAYNLELSTSEGFDADLIRVEGIDLPFYNHSEILRPGHWWWRYYVVNEAGEVSDPSPGRSFIVPEDAVELPVPPTEEIIANMPGHPRIFVTPDTLEEYRERRHGPAGVAWETLQHEANRALDTSIPELELRPIPDDPGSERRQVFVLRDGEGHVPSGYNMGALNRHARLAAALAQAYLISGEEDYALAAAQWLEFLAPFRLDYHLEHRGSHDTVVFAYEYGLKNLALAYDWVHDFLDDDLRAAVVEHIEYHGDNAMRWIRGINLHLNFQNSHGQQCMHALLPTILAIADESEQAAEWADWMIRQYVNRIPYLAHDGGYSEGQYYVYKYILILDALAAMRTATGIDLFQTPRIRDSGDFFLYCMALNYWYQHWGDVFTLHSPIFGSGNDAAISNLLATLTESPYVKWYSETIVANPDRLFLWYASESGLQPKPPVDIPQARAFTDVGKLSAYDRFYDHAGNRIFFRSSRFGAHAHAHADQNALIVHAGGEIMAVDAGYYTAYGDDYWRDFYTASNSHNTLLVNGQSQPISITSRGNISAFFDSPRYCTFTGDASEAYDDLLEQFDRTIIFIRPDIFVVYDELEAPEPSEYTWLLNAFEAAEIDEAAQSMIVRQRHMRMGVHHLTPDDMTYDQTDERPHPVLTSNWGTRVTEMFPQQFNIRVIPAAERAQERILAVMETWDVAGGPAIADLRQVDAGDALALAFERDGLTETVLLQRRADGEERGLTQAGPLTSDALVAAVAQREDGSVARWMVEGASALIADGTALLSADALCDVACDYDSPAAAAQIVVAHNGPARLRAWLPQEPATVLVAPPHEPEAAREVEFAWEDGMLVLALEDAGECVLWVDPLRDLTTAPPPVTLTINDGAGDYALELESAVADTGETIAFGTIDPREQGVYRFTADAELLIQDRWDPTRSTRGHGEITGPLREGAEIFVRFAPDVDPRPVLTLEESLSGQIVSVLRNGDFEEGNPNYPPRGWTVSHPRDMGESWPWWSQEDAVTGESCLKFERPEIRMNANAQPMRLLSGGTYVLRFFARGNAETASVRVRGALGTGTTVTIEPSDTWREYRTEVELEPGYTTLSIVFGDGDPPDQVLWVDDMELGMVAP